MTRTLDRIVHFDERSRQYPIRTLVPAKPRSYTWRCDAFLDQGEEGACVGFAWAHELAARPAVRFVTDTDARIIYRNAQRIDEWPGESYDGTSVLAGAKFLKDNLNAITEYRWAFGLDDLVLAVGHAGPAVLGINWYSDMFDTNKAGYLVPTGTHVGGHAILCHGVNTTGGYFKVHNSWGKDWGTGGEARISFTHMETLLRKQGEACIPIGRK